MKAIILNHMFAGDFLNKNIGHEVINLFADDKGNNYIYLCKDGAFGRKDIDLENSIVVQVQRPAKTINTLEIISVADGLSLVNNHFTKENVEPKYGKVRVSKIFANNVQKQDRYLTFKATNIYIPKNPILIYYGVKKNSGVYLENYNPSQTLREYILEGSKEYEELSKVMSAFDNGKWKIRDASKSKVESYDNCALLATDIYGIQTRELSYSNALGYYIEKYHELFRGLFTEYIKNKKLPETSPVVYREWKNIDLIVKWGKYVFVIENKICSDINGVQPGGRTQLEKYQDIMSGAVEDEKCAFNKKKPVYVFLTPNHNNIALSNNCWQKIEYSEIVDALSGKIMQQPYNNDYLFQDFFRALCDQASTNLNACIMERKFKNAIQTAKKRETK